MNGDKQDITAGNNSTNIQGNKVTVVNNGISYVDAREIALQTFKDNFYELSEVAKKTGFERAEELVNNFLEKLQNETLELISKIETPDVQYSVINAQKQFARNGRKENLQLLVDLLTTRFQLEEGSLKSIVINEAIEVASKLTTEQIKSITTIFLLKNCKFNIQNDDLSSILNALELVMPKEREKDDVAFYQHLVYTGVALRDDTTLGGQNLGYVLYKNYKGNSEEINTLDEIERKLNNDPNKSFLFNIWNNNAMKNYTLTSVGMAISLAHYNNVNNSKIDLNIWIKD